MFDLEYVDRNISYRGTDWDRLCKSGIDSYVWPYPSLHF